MTKNTGEDWVGVPALAKGLGVTMRLLYKLLDAGNLPAYRVRQGHPDQTSGRRGVSRPGRG